ncbi:hypothetical protein BJ741DRAFT_632709, partial [Chytriomyces cf. hyalinus JEL632]
MKKNARLMFSTTTHTPSRFYSLRTVNRPTRTDPLGDGASPIPESIENLRGSAIARIKGDDGSECVSPDLLLSSCEVRMLLPFDCTSCLPNEQSNSTFLMEASSSSVSANAGGGISSATGDSVMRGYSWCIVCCCTNIVSGDRMSAAIALEMQSCSSFPTENRRSGAAALRKGTFKGDRGEWLKTGELSGNSFLVLGVLSEGETAATCAVNGDREAARAHAECVGDGDDAKACIQFVGECSCSSSSFESLRTQTCSWLGIETVGVLHLLRGDRDAMPVQMEMRGCGGAGGAEIGGVLPCVVHRCSCPFRPCAAI